FPETVFCGMGDKADENIGQLPDNACFYNAEHQYGSFMGGVAAGLATEADHVGAVVGMDIPVATRQAEGFHLGAKCVNPDVKFSESFTGDFNDTSKAKSAAEAMYGDGADVIIGAVDAA